jgi:hypothetical protein
MLKFNDGDQHFKCLVRMLKVFLFVSPKHSYVKSIMCQILTLIHWEQQKGVLPFWNLFWKNAAVFGEESIELSFSLLGRALQNDGRRNILEHVARKYRSVRSYLDLKAELGDDYYGKNTMKSVSGRSEENPGSLNVAMVRAWLLTTITKCRRNMHRPYKSKKCFADAATGARLAVPLDAKRPVSRVFRLDTSGVLENERQIVTDFSVSDWLNKGKDGEGMKQALETDDQQVQRDQQDMDQMEQVRDEMDDFQMGSAPEEEEEVQPLRNQGRGREKIGPSKINRGKKRRKKKSVASSAEETAESEEDSSEGRRHKKSSRKGENQYVTIVTNQHKKHVPTDYTNRVAERAGSATKKKLIEEMKAVWHKENPGGKMTDKIYYGIEAQAIAASCQQVSGRRTRGSTKASYKEVSYTGLAGMEKDAMRQAVAISVRNRDAIST